MSSKLFLYDDTAIEYKVAQMDNASNGLKVSLAGVIGGGLATEAKQDVIISHVDGVEASLTSIDGKITICDTTNLALESTLSGIKTKTDLLNFDGNYLEVAVKDPIEVGDIAVHIDKTEDSVQVFGSNTTNAIQTYTSGVLKNCEFQFPDGDSNIWDTHALNDGDNSDPVDFQNEKLIGIWGLVGGGSPVLEVQVSPDNLVWANANITITPAIGFFSASFETPFRYIRLNCVTANSATVTILAIGK